MTLTDFFLKIRPIPDDPESLRQFVSEGEWTEAMSMKPAARQAEWLAWRAAARERLGREITIIYDCNGGPVLPEGAGHIGISHTRGWVAVVWSSQPCAVDIEPAERDVSRTQARFISEEERALSDFANPLFPISVWCAKEAAYKLARIAGLDFLRDIRITSSDISGGQMEVSIKGGKPVPVALLFRDGLVVAVIA